MTDILTGLIAGSTPFLVAWVFPSSIILAVFALVVFPSIADLPLASSIQSLDSAQRLLLLAFAAVALGLVLNALSTPLYRFLEGYLWPKWMRERGKTRQSKRKRILKERVGNAPDGWEKALLFEKLQRYPVQENQIAPSTLGNALRAFETYGVDRYNLDSQSLWIQLLAVVPPGLRDDVTTSRTAVDFFVCLVHLSTFFGAAALAAGALASDSPDWGLIAWGMVALILTRAWYRGAIAASTYWSATVRALVDLGRKPLADSLALRLPASIDEERTMWALVAAFKFYDYDAAWAPRLDAYRTDSNSVAARTTSPDNVPVRTGLLRLFGFGRGS